ncbi:hypothetical protein RJ641_026036 [Dillenia turbinata]|uniref:Uncharacterized protein n=1 Tax=Dillenia turbinata TaxID=194707 RepID=A0AAN8W2K4_9MAGN
MSEDAFGPMLSPQKKLSTEIFIDTHKIPWSLLSHLQDVHTASTENHLSRAVRHLLLNLTILAQPVEAVEEKPLERKRHCPLMLSFFGLRLAWRLAMDFFKSSFSYARCFQTQIHGIITQLQKTLRGSADDIGWLQNTPGMPPLQDSTARFQELLQVIRNGQHTLPDSFVYLFIPVEHNAWELKQYIEELYWGSSKRVMLLGHSKGGVDAAAALSIYWPDLKDKVAGLALVQSPYGGSPIASDILREGQIADKDTRRIVEFLICKLIKGDIRALEDLTYDKRKEFISKHKLPEQIPLISFHSEASIGPGVIATMSHIAHAELPWLPLPTFGCNKSKDVIADSKVPVVVPFSAVLAVCALHLWLRYGEKSDGMVTCRDAEVPGSVVVRPDRKLDHVWMVYSPWKRDFIDPDACEMCEALLTMLVELGNKMGCHVFPFFGVYT